MMDDQLLDAGELSSSLDYLLRAAEFIEEREKRARAAAAVGGGEQQQQRAQQPHHVVRKGGVQGAHHGGGRILAATVGGQVSQQGLVGGSPPHIQVAVQAAPPPASTSTNPVGGVAAAAVVSPAQQQQLRIIEPRTTPPEQHHVVSSSTPARRTAATTTLNNSFDIINAAPSSQAALVIDESIGSGGEGFRRRQPPLVFRAGTREVHNKLEKDRRAQLKCNFDQLKKLLPAMADEKKTSNLNILHSALRYIHLQTKKEHDLEFALQEHTKDKIQNIDRVKQLKAELASFGVDSDELLGDGANYAEDLAAKIAAEQEDDQGVRGAANARRSINHHHHHHSTDHQPSSSSAATVMAVAASSSSTETIQQHQRVVKVAAPSGTSQLTIATATPVGAPLKEVTQQSIGALSVVPVSYPVSQGLVLQKLIVQKGVGDLPIVSTTHFLQQHAKVVPLVNAQYVVKPVVVVSRPS